MDVLAKIRRLLADGETHRGLCKKLGVSPAYLAVLLSRPFRPRYEVAERLAQLVFPGDKTKQRDMILGLLSLKRQKPAA